jgi:hypothetical protein
LTTITDERIVITMNERTTKPNPILDAVRKAQADAPNPRLNTAAMTLVGAGQAIMDLVAAHLADDNDFVAELICRNVVEWNEAAEALPGILHGTELAP